MVAGSGTATSGSGCNRVISGSEKSRGDDRHVEERLCADPGEYEGVACRCSGGAQDDAKVVRVGVQAAGTANGVAKDQRIARSNV